MLNEIKIMVANYEGIKEIRILTNICHMPLLLEVLKEHYKTNSIYILELIRKEDKSVYQN